MNKFGLILLVLFGSTLSGIYYVWHQATKLPDWYQEGTAQAPRDIQQTTASVQQKIRAKAQQSLATQSSNMIAPSLTPAAKPSAKVEVKLDQDELNDVLVAKIAEKGRIQTLPKSVKGVRTTVENNTLKTGAVVDMKELKESNLGAQEKTFLNQAAQKIPGLSDRKVYIGVEGKPRVQDGKVQFDDQMKVRVGNLSLSITEIADRLGVSPEQVKERLQLELQLQDLNVKDIELQNGSAVLRGSPTPNP